MTAQLEVIPINGARHMVPVRPQNNEGNWFQREILLKLAEVKVAVDESLKLGRENATSLSNLRTELGVDGVHGRLPQLEQQYARLDRSQEIDHKDVIKRLLALEKGDHINQGKRQVATIVISVVCSSGFAVFLGWLANHLGILK